MNKQGEKFTSSTSPKNLSRRASRYSEQNAADEEEDSSRRIGNNINSPSDVENLPITQRKLILEQVTARDTPTPTRTGPGPGERSNGDRVNYGDEINEDERIAKLDQ